MNRPSEGALAVVAEIGREPRRIIYLLRLRVAGFLLKSSCGNTRSIPTRGQESNSRTISRFPRNCAGRSESGRGRRALAPWQIPWQGWKDILWRVYASINDNRLLAVAAGVVFYSLLAIFPAIAAFVSLYGLIADASTIDAHLSLAAGIFPAGAVQIPSTSKLRRSRQKVMQSSASGSSPGLPSPSGAPTPE